jgi:hypothetical protein
VRSERGSGLETLFGSITSVGFASGHRFVVGCWDVSPIGPFADVMWANPDGERTLLATEHAAEFITGVYPFDLVRHTPVEVVRDGTSFEVRTDPVELRLVLSRLWLPFPPRPRWVTATVENAIARLILGVRSFGTSPTGVDEWYRTRTIRLIRSGQATVGGSPGGELGTVARPIGFGFTDPPERPSHVTLRVDLRR